MYAPELRELEALIEEFSDLLKHRVLAQISYKGVFYPLHCVTAGSENPTDPCFVLVGGIHGLEKIGSEVVLAYMRAFFSRMKWDGHFVSGLDRCRVVFIPIANPVGVTFQTRSNGSGVDLMRNAPLDADEAGGFIHRGHRISPKLPYYRGQSGILEPESKAIVGVLQNQVFGSKVALLCDVHSGFGTKDRFWFPFGHSKKPFPQLAEAHALKTLLDYTYTNHVYEIEPMARQYTIHGDLWDYAYLEHRKNHAENVFLPWTLEMGSWVWLKKNPTQVFSPYNVFHPILPHRRRRILRRHVFLFDFLLSAVRCSTTWCNLELSTRQKHEREAMGLWYEV